MNKINIKNKPDLALAVGNHLLKRELQVVLETPDPDTLCFLKCHFLSQNSALDLFQQLRPASINPHLF